MVAEQSNDWLHHAGKVDEDVGAWVCVRGVRHAALHGNRDLLAPEEHLLKATPAAWLHHARHGGRRAACSCASRCWVSPADSITLLGEPR